jgi:hypothetical protein
MKWNPERSDIKSKEQLQRELESLYLRKSAVVELIRSLEQYDRFQAKPGSSRSKKIA